MKTLQLIATAIIFSLTSASFANGDDEINKNSDNSSNLTLTIIEVQNPSCNGGNDGTATVLAKGGKAPYTYNWNTFPAQSAPMATNLSSGTFFVQVKDANGEVIFKSIKVEDPTASIMNEFEPGTSGPIDITATVTGENAPYSFELNGQLTESQKIENLPVGIHKLVITDANQCEMVQYIQVYEYKSNSQDATPSKNYRINTSKEKLESKKDRQVETSSLTPTQSIGQYNNLDILVTVSSH